MKFKRTIEPRQLKQFKAFMLKSTKELRAMAMEQGIELTPDTTKKEIINKLFQNRGE